MNKVEELFIKEGIVVMRPNQKWFVMSKQISIQFIDQCEKEQIQILGIDGFYLHENGRIQPSMINSMDFTSSLYNENKNNLYENGRQFIESRQDDLYFQIICDG